MIIIIIIIVKVIIKIKNLQAKHNNFNASKIEKYINRHNLSNDDLNKIINEICLENKVLYHIDENIIIYVPTNVQKNIYDNKKLLIQLLKY